MLPSAPDVGGVASPDRVVDMLQTIQVPSRDHTPPSSPAASAQPPVHSRASSGPRPSTPTPACSPLHTQPATFFPGPAPLQRPDQGSAALALRHTAPFLHHQPRHQLWHQPGRVPRRSGRRVPAEAAERCRVSGVGGGVQGGVHGLRGAACATGTRKHASGGSVG